MSLLQARPAQLFSTFYVNRTDYIAMVGLSCTVTWYLDTVFSCLFRKKMFSALCLDCLTINVGIAQQIYVKQ